MTYIRAGSSWEGSMAKRKIKQGWVRNNESGDEMGNFV
jgi:hypothetical protein